MPATQETPQLTLYRNGLVNLNGEATRAMATKAAKTLLLLPPTHTEPRWLLPSAAEGMSGDIRLHGRADRGNFRFRAPGLAVSLFAALPPSQEALRLHCEPVAQVGGRLYGDSKQVHVTSKGQRITGFRITDVTDDDDSDA